MMTTHPLLKQLRHDPTRPARYGEWTVDAEQAETDSIGIKAGALHFRHGARTIRDAGLLAERLAGRVDYLLEPLAVIEAETETALLRSRIDRGREKDTEYYEIWVTPERFTMDRYHSRLAERRQRRPFSLTWEQTERLVRDVTGVYESPES